MDFKTRFDSLPVPTKRLLGIGVVLALAVALPLFVWSIITQRFLINKRAASGEPGVCIAQNKIIIVTPSSNSNGTCHDIQEAIDAANAMLLVREMPQFLPSDTRRNILTEGIDLNALVGVEFVFGSIVFRGTELADPCHRPSALIQKMGFKAVFEGRGGLRAEPLTDGELCIGDEFQYNN